MATETSPTDKLETKENQESIEEKMVSVNEEKHDKSEDAQGPTIPLAKTEGVAEGEDRKVGAENTNDSVATATEASGDGNLKTEEDNKANAALAEEEKNDDSLSLRASVTDNLQDEKELISESPAISVTETASDAPKSQSQETPPTTVEQKQPEIPDSSFEIDPPMESEAGAVKETQNSQVQEKSQDPEMDSQLKGHVEEPNTDAAPECSVETMEKTREPEFNAIAEVVTETANYGAGPTETDKQSGPEEQQKTVIPATSAESTEQPGDEVEVQPPKESDIGIVEKTSNLEAVPLSTEGEETPIENLQLVGEFAKPQSEGTSDDIKDSTLISKQEEETSVAAQVSLDKKAQVANEAESSPGIAENVVEEDGQKEPSCTDVIQGVVSKESVGVLENPELVFVTQEAKTALKEEKEDSAAPSAEEKLAAIDDNKEGEAPDVVEGLSREADTAISEEEQAKLESVEDDQPADDNEREGHAEIKVDEITTAVVEPVRETLASKLKEKEEESITTGMDKLMKKTVEEPVTTGFQKPDPPTKETAAKPPQKQSNNILSKVKQSLVKAKKAITGKSPTTKTISSATKGDIQVKKAITE